MALVTKIATVRKNLKISFINTDAVIPNFEVAEDYFIKPIVNNLWATIAAGNEDNPTELRALVHKAIIPLGYLMDLPFIHASITDSGINTQNTDNRTPVTRWAYEKIEENLSSRAAMAIENLWSYLYANTPNGWDVPTYKSIFSGSSDFSDFYTLYQPYRTYENLKPIIVLVEDSVISNAIGTTFYNELKNSTATDDDIIAAKLLLKKAIAQFTIAKAAVTIPVKITSYGFTSLLDTNTDKPNQGERNANDSTMAELVKSTTENGKKYLKELTNFLNKKASSEKFETFFASDKYVKPIEATPSTMNDNQPTFFL